MALQSGTSLPVRREQRPSLAVQTHRLSLLRSRAVDMDDPLAVVSPGGVGFDINCGVRLIRTNLSEKDVKPVQVWCRRRSPWASVNPARRPAVCPAGKADSVTV